MLKEMRAQYTIINNKPEKTVLITCSYILLGILIPTCKEGEKKATVEAIRIQWLEK
jgi:hypothetical protein